MARCRGVTGICRHFQVSKSLPRHRWELNFNPSGETTAASYRYSLLSWSCELVSVLDTSAKSIADTKAWPILVRSVALLFDSLHAETASKVGIDKSTTSLTRRTIRQKPSLIPAWLAALASSNKVQYASLLGLVIDVAVRLRQGPYAAGQPQAGQGKQLIIDAKVCHSSSPSAQDLCFLFSLIV